MADITSATSANAGLSFMGQYSGITTDVVDQLIEAESGGKILLQNKVTTYNKQKAAWSSVSSTLSNLQTKLQTLQNNDSYYTKTTKSSAEDYATISGSANSKSGGEFALEIEQLAKQTKLTGSQLTSVKSNKTALDLTGKLTFAYSGTVTDDSPATVDIEISAGDSLVDIADKINKQSSTVGVSATVIDRRLVLTNNAAGQHSSTLDQSANGDTLAALGLTGDAALGQAAKFTLDGIEMERDSNTVTDGIEGATLTLKKVTDAANSVSLSLVNDSSTTVKAVQDFVDQYNSTMSIIKGYLDVGDPTSSSSDSTTTNTQGDLVGDSTLQRLQSSLRSLVTQSDKTNTNSTLGAYQLGLSVDKDGVLSLDSAKLQEQLDESPEKVHDFFYVQVDEFDDTQDKGYTTQLNSLLNTFITDTDDHKSVINNTTTSLDKMVKSLNDQIDDFTERLAAKREQYITQFTALDTMMMNAQSQLDYMQSQLGTNSSSNN
ncbi:flagellum hook associated protein FliD [Ligilactobacillus salitolerans]|uniref:Flagellar hook-associated protein 2 n=1 Tax=Ligilactobacillus salitolerans TaxID=1808352 RepID=A0A401IVX6_9LACO|nr:flagellar filament capping protein FliD [Ligilactobacillus salitolerans]GBG95711.1 flagellum hook associated protein FliD [Ligilactobacillus salitolerans]